MKRHRKSLIITVCILTAAAVTAAAAGTYSALTQPKAQQPGVQITAQRQTLLGQNEDPVYTYLAEHYEGDVRYELVQSYAVMKMTSRPTAEEIQQLAFMLESGIPLEDVLEIYRFWMTTNEPISTMEHMANYWNEEVALSDYWTEDAYNQVTNNTDVLSTEQIYAYLEDGLSPEDISTANIFSRKGTHTIAQILQKREAETSWIEIILDIYTQLGIELAVNQDNLEQYKQIEEGLSIQQAIFLASYSEHGLTYWLDLLANDSEQFSEEKSNLQTELVAEELNRLRKVGLFGETAQMQQESASQDAYLEQQLSAMGVDPGQVQQLEAQGYTTLDILNAAQEANALGTSIAQQISLP